MDLSNSPELDRLQEEHYTIAAWFKPEMTPPGNKMVVNDHYFAILVKQGEHEVWPSLCVDGTTAPPPGVFHHVAGVVARTSGKMEVYVNGQLGKSSSWEVHSPAMNFGSTPWRIGIAAPGAGSYRWCAKGVIDEVRLYSRALDSKGIEALYGVRPRPK